MIVYTVINLHHRMDRWAYVQGHLDFYNLTFLRFEAIDLKPGWKGCALSHLAVLDAWRFDGTPFGVLEDDVWFKQHPNLVYECMKELPEDWDCLYLGASPQEPQELYSKHLYRIKNSLCMHAIVWNPRKGGAVDYILEHQREVNKVDVYLSEVIFPQFNCFLTKPLICTQVQFQSDTCQRSDVSTIERNYATYCQQ